MSQGSMSSSVTMSTEIESQSNGPQGAKRKRPAGLKDSERKKVSRACDACKQKKVRCAGTQPCPRCISQDLQCFYNAKHRRGKPAPPQPGNSPSSLDQGRLNTVLTPESQSRDQSTANFEFRNARAPSLLSMEPQRSSQNSQEANEARFEGDYIGPTSGVAFLHRSQIRFQRDLAGTSLSNADRCLQTSIFSYGDGWIPEHAPSFVFPGRKDAEYLLGQYFDFAMPTYRFLHRHTVEEWLESICRSNETSSAGEYSLSNAKRATIIFILATAKLYSDENSGKESEESNIFYAAAEQILTKEAGPVKLESVQARLSQCIHLLASSRVNQAWYVFGTTTQLIMALGLHRHQHPQSIGSTSSDIVRECRKRVFWSAYTLDRYLSVILGRPRIFRDEDVDQKLPEGSNVNFDFTIKTGNRSKNSHSVSDGPVFHARLAKIIGGITCDLYPTHRIADGEWMESAERWTAELKAWKESLPAFLDPSKVDPSMLISIFQRQSTVLRLAYAHALILANRPSLLNNFADLTRRTGLPRGEPNGSLKECIDAAMVVVDTVTDVIEEGKMRKSFWFTHYISFCAISALYVYTIQKCLPRQSPTPQSAGLGATPTDMQFFEAARKCQQSIEETTTETSPFRRYNIILDELKKEVIQHLGLETSSYGVRPRTGIIEPVEPMPHLISELRDNGRLTAANQTEQFALNIGVLSNETFQPLNLEHLHTQHYVSDHLPLHGNPEYDGSFGGTILPGSQGELMSWSEFDSCALTWPDGYKVFEQGAEF